MNIFRKWWLNMRKIGYEPPTVRKRTSSALWHLVRLSEWRTKGGHRLRRWLEGEAAERSRNGAPQDPGGEWLKTRYDLKGNSVKFQAGNLVWLYNPRRRKGRCPKLSPDWEGPCIWMIQYCRDDNQRCCLQNPTRTKHENKDCSFSLPHNCLSGRSELRRGQYYERNPYPGTTPMGSSIYGDNRACSRLPEVSIAASRKPSMRCSLRKGLEAEVAMDSRKTSIAKHWEGNMGLNGGHLRERDYSVNESSPVNLRRNYFVHNRYV